MAGKKKIRRTQEERKAESEAKIVRAAIRIFANQGFMRTTLNEVGQEAGYTGGLVSHKFGSKLGLLQAVMTHITTRFSEDQLDERTRQDSAAESLRYSIDIYIREVAVHEGSLRALYAVMGDALGGEPDLRKFIAAFNRDFKRKLSAVIQRGMDQGEFNANLDADDAAVMVIGTLRGVAMQYLFDRKAFKVKTMIPLLQHTILDSLT